MPQFWRHLVLGEVDFDPGPMTLANQGQLLGDGLKFLAAAGISRSPHTHTIKIISPTNFVCEWQNI